MTVTNLENAVQQQVRAEAEAIQREARQAADAHWERASARLREEHQRRLDAMKAELQGALDRETGSREAEDRMKVLALKNEIIESVFARAVEGVLSQPNDGYRAWLKAQLQCLPKDAELDISANARDRAAMEQLLKEIGSTKARVAEAPAAIKGGFLARGGSFDLDYSVDALMGVLRESMAEEVAAQLFAEERGS